jgi:glycosyltransferase involved in cell wall biosynthesis
MRIVVDARQRQGTGIGRYVTELLDRVPRLDPTTDFVALLRADDRWTPSSDNVRTQVADWPIYSWQEQLRLPGLLRRLAPDLVHFTHFSVPLRYRGTSAVTVHDLTLLRHPNPGAGVMSRVVYPCKRAAMRRVVHHVVTKADAVITDTEYVRRDLAREFADARLDRIDAIGLGAPSLSPAPAAGDVLPWPYVLYVGTFYAHKRVDVLVDAFARCAARRSDLGLVLVGPDDGFADALRRRAHAMGLDDRVRFTGRVGDDELASLYRGAQVLALPSVSEGYGLTGVEAMMHGVPVVAARATCLPEVYGDAAAWVEPDDAAGLAAALQTVVDDAATRARLAAAGRRRVASMSWDETARRTLDVYRRAIERSQRPGPRARGVASSPA